MKLTFLVIIPNHWGRADTPAKAMKIARGEAGIDARKKVKSVLYITNDSKITCSDFGGACYHTEEGMWVTKIDTDGSQVEVWPIEEEEEEDA